MLTIGGLAVAPSAAGRFPADFAPATALQAWKPAAFSTDLANPQAYGSGPAVAAWQAATGGARTLTFGAGDGGLIPYPGLPPLPITGELALTAGVPAGVIPAIGTRAFLSSTGATVGSTVFVTAAGTSVPARIVAAVTNFPTAASGGALVVDQAAIQQVLAGQSAAPLPVNGWWLRTGTGTAPGGLPAGAATTVRSRVAAALLASPLSAAPQQAVLAIAAAAALLAGLGFSVSVAASMRERRTQNALLAALGVSRAAQAGQLCLEELLLSLPAAVAGLLLGAGIAHLLIPAVTLTASATAPVPAALIKLPLGWAAGLGAVVTAIPVLAAAATAGRRPDPAAQLRAAEAA